jgi:hypothetical protein
VAQASEASQVEVLRREPQLVNQVETHFTSYLPEAEGGRCDKLGLDYKKHFKSSFTEAVKRMELY